MKKDNEALNFYSKTISEEFVSGLLEAEGVKPRDGIFKCVLVIWMMICQKLNGKESLAKAIDRLITGEADELLERSTGSIRARTKQISYSTGGYAQARKRVSVSIIEKVFDRLSAAMHSQLAGDEQGVYVIDGTTVQVLHTKENLEYYSSYKNQHGNAHFPLVRVVVATNAKTGLSLRPAIGACVGPNGVSETPLAEEILERLPKKSVVIGDRFYGSFRFIHAAASRGQHPLCRLKEGNCKRFIGTPKDSIGEKHIEWQPSAHELKKYPDLSPSTVVKGRIIWMRLRQQGFRDQLLVLFTTLDLPLQEIIELYALRWNVESDFRDMKQTLSMQFIEAKTPDMIKKELILGIAAYNLVKHCISAAAEHAKLPPRSLSFSMALHRISVLGGLMLSNRSDEDKQKILQRGVTDIRALVIYRRPKRRPPEPRKVWPRGQRCYFSSSTSREYERNLILQQLQLHND